MKHTYYDGEKMVEIEGKIICSQAGHTRDVEQPILYALDEGGYLFGVRHQDRGDLMTNVKYYKRCPPKKILDKFHDISGLLTRHKIKNY